MKANDAKPHFTVQRNGTAQQFDQSFYNGQSQTCAPVFAVDFYRTLRKTFKDFMLFILEYPNAIIGYLEFDFDGFVLNFLQ